MPAGWQFSSRLCERWPRRRKPRKRKPAVKADDSGIKIVARNRRARHDYELLEKVEAGHRPDRHRGQEPAQRQGEPRRCLRRGRPRRDLALGCDIPEYVQANRMNHVPKRPRKLLLHRREIDKLKTKTGEKGMTLVPLSIYFKKGIAKVELCIAKGRKTFDKREAIKKQDAKRDIDRAMRRR